MAVDQDVLVSTITAACHLVLRHGARGLVTMGVRDIHRLAQLQAGLRICVVDAPDRIAALDPAIDFSGAIAWDVTRSPEPAWEPATMTDMVIVVDLASYDVPDAPLAALRTASGFAPATIILGREVGDDPLDAEACHEAPVAQLRALCRKHGLDPVFSGLQGSGPGRRPIAILDSIVAPNLEPAPDDFRVIAIMTSYNEADVIVPAISGLADEGVGVYLIDNWSNDGTFELASEMLGRGLVGIERFPDAPPTTYDWSQLLRRKEELTATLGADWYIHHDADERRRSPWRGVTLRDALWAVDRSGFTAVDHTVTNHPPIDDGFRGGTDFEAYFGCFEWGMTQGDNLRANAWKAMRRPAVLHRVGGHMIQFSGFRAFPYNFLLEHYPMRSQAHGERKVLGDRKPRWNAAERAAGWHVQYDSILAGHEFLRAPAELIERDPLAMEQHDLLVRLSRVGIAEANAVAALGAGRCPGDAHEFGVSVVVLTSGDGRRAERAIVSALAATAPAGDVDLVVVSNGTRQPGPAATALDLDARWLRFAEPVPPAIAWRRGIAAARCGHVLVLSDDVEVAADALGPLLDAIEPDATSLVATTDPVPPDDPGAAPTAAAGVLRFGLGWVLRTGCPSTLVGVPGVLEGGPGAPGPVDAVVARVPVSSLS